MAFADAKAAIRNKAAAEWSYAVPLFWANENNTPPLDDAGDPQPFVHVEIVGGAERAATKGAPGNNLYRQSGEIIARVFVPTGSGETLANEYADAFAAIFREQIFSDVHCWTASVTGGNADDNSGNYYQMDVIVNFSFDHRP